MSLALRNLDIRDMQGLRNHKKSKERLPSMKQHVRRGIIRKIRRNEVVARVYSGEGWMDG